MKKIITVISLISLFLPTLVLANFSVGWQATSTTQGSIFPNLISGTYQGIQVPFSISTSTTATSTFAGPVYISTKGNAMTSPSYLRIGSTTVPGYANNYLFDAIDSRNDFVSANVWNISNSTCATSDLTVNNDIGTVSSNFGDLGHTSSIFSGSGCVNNPFTGFHQNSTYLYDPTGYMTFALGSTTNAGFQWMTGGYDSSNVKMMLTNAGFLALGSTTPDSHLTITNDLTSYISAPVSTQLHIVQSTANARIVGDTYQSAQTGTNYQGRHARGTNLLPTAVTADDSLVLIGGSGYGTTKFTDVSVGSFVVRAEATFTDTSAPTYLSLFTTPNGSVTPAEKARLTGAGLFGIGTTTPYAYLSIQTASTTGDAFAIATSSNHAVFGIDNDGHAFTSGPVGVISSCGTGSGTVVGDDQSGTITTATAATACTMTFSKAYRATPVCTVTDNSLVGFADIASVSISAVTFGISSALTGGNLYYQCVYHK